jgi:hypothetical protein
MRRALCHLQLVNGSMSKTVEGQLRIGQPKGIDMATEPLPHSITVAVTSFFQIREESNMSSSLRLLHVLKDQLRRGPVTNAWFKSKESLSRACLASS